jgi:hypothetical protein
MMPQENKNLHNEEMQLANFLLATKNGHIMACAGCQTQPLLSDTMPLTTGAAPAAAVCLRI